jgi:hypothetical protein
MNREKILKTVDFHKLNNLEKDALVDFLSTCDENNAIDYIFFVIDSIDLDEYEEPFTVTHRDKLKPLFIKAKDICMKCIDSNNVPEVIEMVKVHQI